MPGLDPLIGFCLLALIGGAALLYSSVGHGGASGYLAAMALVGLEPALMKPAALTMNVFVTVLVLARLAPRGCFNWRLFLPLMLGSVPMAYLGGAFPIDAALYRYILGFALILAFVHMMWQAQDRDPVATPKPWIMVPVGGIIGFVSGMTGVGGGIFLSPLLLFFMWTNMRGSAAIAAAFVLCNSLSGLAGYASVAEQWPSGIALLVGAAALGALLGSELCVRRMTSVNLRRMLGVVLAIAGIKMIATA